MKKKLFLTALLATVSAFALVFTSCSKDEGKGDEPVSIVGTVWERVETDGITLTFRFSGTTCSHVIRSGSVARASEYEYTLDFPKVHMQATDAGIADLEGTISDNKMTVKNLSQNKIIGIYTRK